RYGSPSDLAHLVDTLHEAGIGVILDWVPAHFAIDGFGLRNFDGAPLFESDVADRSIHPTWKTALFDYRRPHVRSFLMSSARYWIETFHIDGLRVDGVEAILYSDHGMLPESKNQREENPDGVSFLRELTDVLHQTHPDVLLIAEDSSAWQGVTRPTHVGG